MISSITRLILESLVFLVFLQIAIVYASGLPLAATDFKLEQDDSAQSESEELSPMSKEEFRRDMTRQLLMLQQAEADVLNRIRELEAERIALSQRKRSHYTSMCMFNVVACYKKRR